MNVDSTFVPITLIPLCIASYQDYRSRTIDDKIWLLQGFTGFVNIFIFLSYQTRDVFFLQITLIVLNGICSCFVSFILYSTKAWGGADSKAIIALSLSFPLNVYELSQTTFLDLLPPILFILFNFLLVM
ncbi:MAG: prepilin peptidase, partial [Candidatus Kariarchaeaceae archaeon]